MRTAGVLQMDTPLPDGRILVRPQDFVGGGVVSLFNNVPLLAYTGGAVNLVAETAGLLLRTGMSDDAQQQFGKGSPSGGYQGAQGQPVTPTSPFTTPYGQSGRPPYPSAQGFSIANLRPKGLKPMAVTVVYTAAGGPLASFQVALYKTAFNVGVAPTATTVLTPTNLPLQNAVTQIITTPIPVANQAFLADPFDALTVILSPNAGAATLTLFGVYIDVAFNYN